jgi:protein-S-isoprenylcysteine O-methyltransferase Ste14
MFARALLAFLALPGVVAFAVPVTWLFVSAPMHVAHPVGLALLLAGTGGLLSCVYAFYVSGKGTLAPWAPPVHLVQSGLYRYTRNPMYVSVTLILLGWALSFGFSGLYLYAFFVAIAFHLRVVFGEEPWLAQKYGAQWSEYASRVPRWFF